jgi:hypothetical protein
MLDFSILADGGFSPWIRCTTPSCQFIAKLLFFAGLDYFS